MNRVVITGLGVVSSIGNSVDEVLASLRNGRSGVVYSPRMKELGYHCCLFAPVAPPDLSAVPARLKRWLSTANSYAVAAAFQAVRDAQLDAARLQSERTGVVFGTGGAAITEVLPWSGDDASIRRPSQAIQVLGASPAMVVAEAFGVKGPVTSLSVACATGLYNLGHAFELVRWGTMDVCITGSTEGEQWQIVGQSADNSRGMPTGWNDRPTEACRPFDRDRKGFIISAGAGALVFETLEHAQQRGARIYAEVVGYGAANDGADMFNATGDGLRLSIDEAMATASELGVTSLDYINAHATGTPAGDPAEAQSLAKAFGKGPLVSSTKGQTGHAQGGTASQEAVFTVLMLHHGFVAPTVNLDNIDPECDVVRHVQQLVELPIHSAMTTNNGLGAVNACLVLRKHSDS
jgi:3-oxoacyl-[acyl-carrier-protein] synthase-1